MNTKNLFEQEQGKRFAFGENWSRFLSSLNEKQIIEAEKSLKDKLEVENLEGKSFLDIGCGSGLFSLAARRLGARVTSFDYDDKSAACTKQLKHRFFNNDTEWTIQTGSVLNQNYLKSLGEYDIVYSWGVLHHTGDMWQALENVTLNVKQDGKLFIALYNKQPVRSRYWLEVKKLYNKHKLLRPILIVIHAIYPTLPSIIVRKLSGRKLPRGMNPWHDLIDWVGGYPFEVSEPEEIFKFYKLKGYDLLALTTCGGGMGCNEYVFIRL